MGRWLTRIESSLILLILFAEQSTVDVNKKLSLIIYILIIFFRVKREAQQKHINQAVAERQKVRASQIDMMGYPPNTEMGSFWGV